MFYLIALKQKLSEYVRPQNIQENVRKCFVCQVLEDMFHFILECPMYKELEENIFIAILIVDKVHVYWNCVVRITTNTSRYLNFLGEFIYHAF